MRLSLENLKFLKTETRLPKFAPVAHKVGIVHLGIGAFHRAHQAWYTHKLLEQEGGDWRIRGVSLRSAGVRDTLNPQDGLFTVAIKSNQGTDHHMMASVESVLVAPENPAAVIAALCEENVHVVTLTITEKGYCLTNSTGELDPAHESIVHDLEHLHSPKSALGFLIAACQRRMRTGMSGLTIVSCDNLAGNGTKLEAALTGFAALVDPALQGWLNKNVTFPATMVDRIVPATTPEDKATVEASIGMEDQACVMAEPFIQWVIEARFAGPFPAWDQVGVTFAASVEPFEDMKLRLLNATHSTIAYLGCLAGYATVAEAVADPNLRHLIDHMMAHELAPTLHIPNGVDIEVYAKSLLERYTNRGLPHKTRQIAMDGSQKIPQRMLPALRHQLKNGGSVEGLTLGIAAWIRYCEGVEENGDRYLVDDPMASIFQDIHAATDGDTKARLESFLALENVFDQELVLNETFREKLLFWLKALAEQGARSVLAQHWASNS